MEEIPQFFECFNRSFEFATKSTIASIICLSAEEPCYADFNAYPLYEALQIALMETDGCFVCFAGNPIGNKNDLFFIFDSHSRSEHGLVLMANVQGFCLWVLKSYSCKSRHLLGQWGS